MRAMASPPTAADSPSSASPAGTRTIEPQPTPSSGPSAHAQREGGAGPIPTEPRVAPAGSWRAFFGEFVRDPRSTAAIAPSSRALAARMLAGVDWDRVRTVVEFGPGTGVFTLAAATALAAVKNPPGRLIAVELNDRLARDLPGRLPAECAALTTVVHGNACDVERIVQDRGSGAVDLIISGLGWPSINPAIRDQILEATHRVLRPAGQFRTFGYHIGLTLPGAWGFRRTVRRLFKTVEISRVVWGNIPPAFVYTCTKA